MYRIINAKDMDSWKKDYYLACAELGDILTFTGNIIVGAIKSGKSINVDDEFIDRYEVLAMLKGKNNVLEEV
jgi:hypothetical protein